MTTTKTQKKRRPRGTGSIYYDSSRKRYMGQVDVNIGNGKTKKKTLTGRTKTEVSDKIKDMQMRSQAGEFIDIEKPEVPTVQEYAEQMFDEQLALNEIRQSSHDRKMETLKMLSGISDNRLDELTEEDIISFFKAQLDYSQSCLTKMYQLLGAVYKKAIKRNIVADTPLKEFKCPKSNKPTVPVRALTVNEQKNLLDVLKHEDVRYSDIMLLSMFTGMRIGECCALMVEDINFDEQTLRVSKTVARGKFGKNEIHEPKTSSGTRTLFINDELADFLKGVIGDKKSGVLFLSSNDNLVTTNQVNYSYAAAIKKFSIVDSSVYGKVNLHSLRHTYATRCIESGMPAKVLQKIMGHSDINITLDIYCSVFEKFRNEHLAIADEYMRSNNLSIA